MKPSANNCKQLMHANKVQADEIIQLREELIRYRREWQRECEQTDLLLQGLGLCPSEYRSEGGSLLVGRIAHKLKRNCARCNDTGLVFDERTITQRRPCPDCTDLRRLLEKPT